MLEYIPEFRGGDGCLIVVASPLASEAKKVVSDGVDCWRRRVGSVRDVLTDVGNSIM